MLAVSELVRKLVSICFERVEGFILGFSPVTDAIGEIANVLISYTI